MDWTAPADKATPYFLVEMTDETFTQSASFTEFNIKTAGDKWVDIECRNCNLCLPVYKFSGDPQKLEDLDFSKLVRLKNQNGETWQKYLVFDLDKGRMTKNCSGQSPHFYRWEDNKSINNWKDVYKDKTKEFPIVPSSEGVAKNYLRVEAFYNSTPIYPILKIINFLTPSFDLDKAIKKD